VAATVDVVTMRRVRTAYRRHRDPARAQGMKAYMRDQFAFLGIPTPERRALDRTILDSLPPPSQRELQAIARGCWELPEREFQYFATDHLQRHVRRCRSSLLPSVRRLIVTKSWWDTVDALAARVVGPLVAADAQLGAEMDAWLESPNLWLARSAILHQLTFKDATDAERLFDYCLARAADTDFFLRKAIGWALREYSKTDASAVRRFVRSHERELSPLSQREALKRLTRG
jgi:3-methyladenine DNA glycosylase AlkD